MNINWFVRLKNPCFWLTAIPAILLLITQVAGLFGLVLDLSAVGQALDEIGGTVFTLLALLGIVIDPTTEGLKDSTAAMSYTAPKVSDEEANTAYDGEVGR